MAKKQDEKSWWEEVKAELKKLQRTVTEQSRIFPANGRGTVRGKGFEMSECKEFLSSKTEIHRRTMGKMMWEEEWLDFARTVVDRTVVQTQKLCGTSGQNPHLAFSGVTTGQSTQARAFDGTRRGWWHGTFFFLQKSRRKKSKGKK